MVADAKRARADGFQDKGCSVKIKLRRFPGSTVWHNFKHVPLAHHYDCTRTCKDKTCTGMASSLPSAKDEKIASILAGQECTVSFPGLSQYMESYSASGSGSSACGLASFNCAKFALCNEHSGIQGQSLLRSLVLEESFQVRLSSLPFRALRLAKVNDFSY